MSEHDSTSESTPKAATIAAPRMVAKAFARDLIGWTAPWLLFAIVVGVVPELGGWEIVLLVVVAIASLSSALITARHFAKYGYTNGMMRCNLRAVDLVDDQVLYKARLFPKSLFKLLMGKYVIIVVSF
jgi:hypothetical protein